MKKKLLRLIKMCSYYSFLGLLAQVVFYNFLFASDLSAQKVKSVEEVSIAVKLENVGIKDAFQQIEDQTDYQFAYEERDLDTNVKINYEAANTSVKDVLLEISKEAALSFRQVNNDIDVKKIQNNKKVSNSQRVEIYQGDITVRGKVNSVEDDAGLPGVNVIIKGTSNGTVTDINGDYTIEVPSENTVLVYSSVGFVQEERTVGTNAVINVTLDVDIKELSEIVVIGYGQVETKDATGAVTSIKEEDFNKGVISSPEQLIQGRTAGVQVTSSSGEPGAGINVRIRGTSSVRNNNDPLFVVDGVPLSGDDVSGGVSEVGFGRTASKNPLNFLNPNDIASIDILKDASATAIYGSRGANGVVIITTKSGKAGAGILNYTYNFGVSNITKKYDLLDPQEFLDAYADFNGSAAAAALDGGAETDWQDEILRTAFTQNHNLSFGGGAENSNFRFSLGYMDQEGIVKNSGLTRYTARFNGSKSFINDRLKISTQLTIADTHDDNIPITDNSGYEGDLLGAALKANPTQPITDTNGDFVQPSTNSEPNPVAMLELSKDFTNTLRALGNISAEIEIISDLSFKTVLGIDRSMSNRSAAYSRDLRATNSIAGIGRLYFSDITISNDLWENYFTYDKSFDNWKLNAVLGYSYQKFERSTKDSESANFNVSDVDLMINNWATAGTTVGRNSSFITDELQSFFGRVNLSYASKYLLTFTLRADGSTKFGPDNKYGYFPSAAFKWRLVEEGFLPDFLSDLSLRLGYGITGNQEIPHNLYQKRLRYSDKDIDSGGNITGGSLDNVSFSNNGLKWESTSQYNFGLEYGFVNNRIRGSIDYYYKNTNDLLIQVSSAQPAPQPFFWENLDADVINQGFEFFIEADALEGEFKWNINANFAVNNNEVRNYGGLINTGDIDGQGLTGAFAQRIAEGQPLFAFFLRKFAGFDNEGITIYEDGDFQQFVDASPIPTTTAGLTNSFYFKNFDLSFFFTGQFGHYVYSNTANAYFTAGALANGRNVTKDVVGNGESNLNAPDVSTRFLEKGDFVRLQNASIGYNINTDNIKSISKLRFYITGQNLLLFTNYSGQDPEVNVNKEMDGVPSLGIDYTPYPRSRTIMFGVDISF